MTKGTAMQRVMLFGHSVCMRVCAYLSDQINNKINDVAFIDPLLMLVLFFGRLHGIFLRCGTADGAKQSILT